MTMFTLRHPRLGLLAPVLLWAASLHLIQAAEIASAQDNKPTIVVGFAQDTLSNDWRMAQVKALRDGFARYPQVRFIYTDGHGSTAKQIRDVEDLIIRGVDILITSPRDSRAMTPVITRAYKQGIPVILLTRKIEGEAYTTFIAPDDESIARNAARYIAAGLHNRGRVLMLQGVPTASTTLVRTTAFNQELKKYPEITLSAIKAANYLRSDAIKAMEETLQQGIRFDAIYAQSDSMASGARIALKNSGVDLSKILIVGIDYIAEARNAIRNGQQSASFTYPTCGKEAVEAALAISEGKPVARTIRVPSQQVTRENVEQIEPIF